MTLFSAYGKGEPWKQAWGMLHKMRDRSMIPDVISLSAGISACKQADHQELQALVHESKHWHCFRRFAQPACSNVVKLGLQDAQKQHDC